ncbi:AAA family ATPase [Hymenobacter artigasi]|uniref:ATPase n=1 Tax=Hymenobacter artigasi TaxID=2719616 RepID=A0ABX1HE71_9BACT|nr:AAA family ATPase [Hymenobacter artigasi]NKI88505.1 putative ATPase [Hymenobacter artigasi]
MENDIKFLRIQNFKSIKDITLHPRRVNLIIGEPNVGKSNLLEAMTLLGGITYEQTEKFMGSFIRYEEPRQLFYDNLVGNTIKVETDKDVAVLFFDKRASRFKFLFCDLDFYQELAGANDSIVSNQVVGEMEQVVMHGLPRLDLEATAESSLCEFVYTELDAQATFTVDGKVGFRENWLLSPFYFTPKPYTFRKGTLVNQDSGNAYLNPPYGDNLIEIIQGYPQLRQEVGRMFEHYNQKLQLRMDERRLEIIKDQDGIIYSYPYSSVADTLQRIIFYLAAIESNDDAVLLFEEPEAHSFPVYVSKLGRRIVESTSNQFFIDTHSPYLITEILETMLTDDAQAGELAMFAAYYEDHQTKVHQLSDEEIRSIRNDGIDVFYNMKRFTTGAASNA